MENNELIEVGTRSVVSEQEAQTRTVFDLEQFFDLLREEQEQF